MKRVFISLTPEQARALEERRVRERRRTLSDTARAIIEEAVARCGWTCLNGAEFISHDDREEIDRIEAQRHVAMTTKGPDESLKWWNDRLIKPCKLSPLYQHYIMDGMRK